MPEEPLFSLGADTNSVSPSALILTECPNKFWATGLDALIYASCAHVVGPVFANTKTAPTSSALRVSEPLIPAEVDPSCGAPTAILDELIATLNPNQLSACFNNSKTICLKLIFFSYTCAFDALKLACTTQDVPLNPNTNALPL